VAMDLVEAAVRTQRHDEASAHVRALQEFRVGSLSSRLELITAGSLAMVTRDDKAAFETYERALAVPEARRWTFDLARVRLAYGERLRRGRAPSQARGPLADALDTFELLGAGPWAERARVELRATRWTGDRRQSKADTVLTPQEREIAQLAASGLTNRQIAERLFISHRTVGAHLYQIFPKLGISSRAALRDALAEQEE
jgi:DNA-binding CsgD family transcriptional regulator